MLLQKHCRLVRSPSRVTRFTWRLPNRVTPLRLSPKQCRRNDVFQTQIPGSRNAKCVASLDPNCPASSTSITTTTTSRNLKRIFQESSKLAFRLCSFVCVSFAVVSLLTKSSSSVCLFASFASVALESSANSMCAWTGLSAGFLHTLAGPDHFAGLTPLTLGQNQITAVSMGALWGFGHSSGTLLLGIVFLFLKERFHGIIPLLSKWAGTVVGLTLIAIGVLGIYESCFSKHEEDESSNQVAVKESNMIKRGFGTYAMGFIHGLHPDALFVVLPALTLPTALATLSYVVMFVVGTVFAMAGYTLAIGTASDIAVQNRPWLVRHLSTLAASVALVFGFIILIPSLGLQLGA